MGGTSTGSVSPPDETQVPPRAPSRGGIRLAFFPSEVTISREPAATSARNVFRSQIREVVHMGDKVRLSLNGSLPMCAEVSAQALRELAVGQGDTVYASLKATAIKTYR
jgi:molybdate transport system ATP-binding protein